MKTQTKPVTGLTLIFALFTPMLTACGGGGGGGGSSASSSLSSIPWQVNAATARQAATGSTAPTQTAAQALQEISDIGNSANRIVAGNTLVFSSELIPPDRVVLSCSGTTCSGTAPGGTYTLEDTNYDTEEIQPIMVHNGVNIGQRRARKLVDGENVDVYEYGGWMEYSAFVGRLGFPNDNFFVLDIFASGFSLGTNPTGTGTGTWTGAVVGVDYNVGDSQGNAIHGTARVSVDFSTPNVGVTFSNLVNLDSSRSLADMSWTNIPLSSGAFSSGSGSNQIKGRFYGPNHEEVAGTFDRSGIAGAFGATR